MCRHYCVAVFGWDSGSGGASTQFSLLGSSCCLSGGEVGHLALAAFTIDVPEDNHHIIDDYIRNILDSIIQSNEDFLTMLPLSIIRGPIQPNIDGSPIQGVRYLSFWGNLGSFVGGDGQMITSINADKNEMNNRLPNTVKCSRISLESYNQVTQRIVNFVQTPGNWRPTRNCSTLVRESLEVAEHVNGGYFLQDLSFCENLSHGFLDTPNAILSRFPDTIVIEYGHNNLVVPAPN